MAEKKIGLGIADRKARDSKIVPNERVLEVNGEYCRNSDWICANLGIAFGEEGLFREDERENSKGVTWFKHSLTDEGTARILKHLNS